MAGSQNLAIPMKLDAFVFNGKVCDGAEDQASAAKIAPITQPNYTFLRIEKHLAQNDILETVDLHSAWPRKANSRYTNFTDGQPRQNRIGVYVHWVIPRPFRSGITATPTATDKPVVPPKPEQPGDDTFAKLVEDPSSPNYFQLPNRWLVIRTLDPKAETTVPANTSIPAVQSWIIESDKTYSIDELGPEVDLQVDVSPFVTSFLDKNQSPDQISINKQAEVFIGSCSDARGWREGEQDDDSRVELTVASSSNPLFLDYQYHNSNVFSMVDNFAYLENRQTKYLQAARANYYVLGWHSNAKKDLMDAAVNAIAKDKSRAGRINGLGMSLDTSIPNDNTVADWLTDQTSSRSICHGAMYDVDWTATELPTNRAADAFARIMTPDVPPLSVGTTPMDAILSYISDRTPSNDTEAKLAKLQSLLRTADDTIDGNVAAQDEIQNYNYAHFDGGSFYHLPGPDAQSGQNVGTEPSKDEQRAMRLVNSGQHLLDNVTRRQKQLRWEVFACWWRAISDFDEIGGTLPGVTSENYAGTIKRLTDAFADLEVLRSQLAKLIVKEPKAPIKSGLSEDFHQRKDPTLMVAGLESGWPKDFSENLQARLDKQIVPKKDVSGPLPSDYGVGSLADNLSATRELLIQEFLELMTHKDPEEKPTNAILPIYHDGVYKGKPADDNPWRDRWAVSQPWFPLYLEWEAEYVHVDFADWQLKTLPCSKKPNLAPPISYTLRRDICQREDAEPPSTNSPRTLDTNDGPKFDNRSIHGRSLMLPQPAFSLKIQLERLFSTIPKNELNDIISEGDQIKLLANLERISFLSLPLEGLTDHLLTRYQGNHIKPLVRVPGYKPLVMQDVLDVAKKYKIDGKLLADIDVESDPTPYASIPSLVGQLHCAFKPVTHGQMRFTKLNVVDKFGQVVHALDPRDDQPQALYPTVGEFNSVSAVPDKAEAPPQKPGECSTVPNVVDRSRSKTLSKCEFIQLPPSINQPARINASFLIHGDTVGGESYWRPATEWEHPVWGWIVVNYVDNGIQIFLPDGTFYREVRVTDGTTDDTKWLPFQPPAIQSPNRQLDYLIEQMTLPNGKGQAYLRAFMNIISSALQNIVPAPGTYSEFLNSLVGRPLALVNMGWSLELDSEPFSNQSTVEDQSEANAPQQRLLIKDPKRPSRPLYKFPFKLGDKSRNYDGLVGYFQAKPPPIAGEERFDNDLDLSHIYTYLSTDEQPWDPGNLAQPLDNEHNLYPVLEPFWLDPKDYLRKTAGPSLPEQQAAYENTSRAFEKARNDAFVPNVFGAILDPFAPVTCFSSILPVRSLQLPTWTWQTAFKTMTTFFHAGPLLSTDAVPPLSSDKLLAPGYDLLASEPANKLTLPALQAADWNWLMPYTLPKDDASPNPKPPSRTIEYDEEETEGLVGNGRLGKEVRHADAVDPSFADTGFMAVGVVKADNSLGNPGNGPMEALEGFLQLRQPVERDGPLETPVVI